MELSLCTGLLIHLLVSCLSCIVDGRKLRVDEAFHTYQSVTVQIYHGRERRDTTATQDGHLEKVTMVLDAADRKMVLDLVQTKNLVSPGFVLRTYREDDTEFVQQLGPQVRDHCHYQGHVRGHPNSVVAVNTCHGVSGLLSDNTTYYIHPLENTMNGRHGLFKDEDRLHQNFTCGNSDETDHKKRHKRNDDNWFASLKRAKNRWPWQHGEGTRIVELFAVLDNEQWVELERNRDACVQRTKETINVVSALWSQLGVQVMLTGMEIWTKRDKMPVHESAEKTISEFVTYRQRHINEKFPNDNAQLITGQHFKDGIVGKALTGSICTYKWSGGVNMDNYALIGPIATTMAHELGHNLGMSHDSSECSCPDDRCIMAASSGPKSPTHWSSCSKENLEDTFHIGQDYCLRNLPAQSFEGPVCGNGFLEEGEECDCGIEEFCNNPCCNASTCQLTVNSTCATGPCCDKQTCQLVAGGTSCRPQQGVCDLPEFCTGVSEFCPDDVHVYDGKPCEVGRYSSYCYQGYCRTHDSQCKFLWGDTGRMASKQCFVDFNIYGTGHGNCGYDWVRSVYRKCPPEDVMCGMLYCEHRAEKLAFWKNSLVNTLPHFYTYENGSKVYCKGAILDVGLNDHDPGLTEDGVKCGEKMMCMNQKCVTVASLNMVNKCGNCDNHGVCNSKGSCHCDPGYAPPDCKNPGNGGSIHSGPSPEYRPGVSPAVVAVLVCIFLAVLIALLLFLLYKYRKPVMKQVSRFTRPKIRYRGSHHDNGGVPVKSSGSPVTKTGSLPRNTSLQHTASLPRSKSNSLQSNRNSLPRNHSFRGVDISKPVLQDTTNPLSSGNMTDVTYGGPISRAAAPITSPGEGNKHPPARPPPPFSLSITSSSRPAETQQHQQKKMVPSRPAPAVPPSIPSPIAEDQADSSLSSPVLNGHGPYINVPLTDTTPMPDSGDAFQERQKPLRPVRPSRSMRGTDAATPKVTLPSRHASVAAADTRPALQTKPENTNIKPQIQKRTSVTSPTSPGESQQSSKVTKVPSMKFKELQAKFALENDANSKPVSRTPSYSSQKPSLPKKPSNTSYC